MKAYERCSYSLKKVVFALGLFFFSMAFYAPSCLAWIEVPGVGYQVRSEHPRLLFRGQAEWDQFAARITNPANTDETTHYAGCKNYVDNFNYSEGSVGHWTVRFRWYMSNILVAKIEGGSYQTNWLALVKSWVEEGSHGFPESRGFFIPLTFDWFYDAIPQEDKQIYIDWILADAPIARSTYNMRGSWASHTFSECYSTVVGSLAIYGESYRNNDIAAEMEQADFWYHEFVKNTARAAGADGGHFDGTSYYSGHMHCLIYHFWSWATATDEDHFTDSPYFTKIGEWAYVHQRYAENGEIYLTDQGDSWYSNSGSFPTNVVMLNNVKLNGSPYAMGMIDIGYPNGIQNQTWPGSYGYMHAYYLMFKPETWPQPISADQAFTAKRFHGLDHVVWRSGYQEENTCFFYKHNDKMGGHDHHDAGHFEIVRHGRGLAIDSGGYEGGDRSDNHHWQNYFRRTIAHNLVTIFDPDEIVDPYVSYDTLDGGQKYIMSSGRRYPRYHDDLYDGGPFDRGGIIRYDTSGYFNYLMADVTPAYSRSDGSDEAVTNSRKCENYTRQILHLKPDHFVILDRVESYDASFKKRWLLHFQNEPSINGTATGTDPGSGRTDYNGDLSIADNGSARLFVKTLLPAGRTISKRGGEGFEWWAGYDGADAYNAEPYMYNGIFRSELRSPNEIGAWRIEVSPEAVNTKDLFLNVLQAADTSDQQMGEVNLLAGSSAVLAVQVENFTCAFAAEETKSGQYLDTFTYATTSGSTGQHILTDLHAGTAYNVYRGDNNQLVDGSPFTSSENGIITFAAAGEDTFSVVRDGETPDVTADFSADATEVAAGQNVLFTDTSTGGPTAWSWDFDNDGTEDATLRHPAHTYQVPGTYTVSLTVTRPGGGADDTDTVTKDITVISSGPSDSGDGSGDSGDGSGNDGSGGDDGSGGSSGCFISSAIRFNG